MIRRRPSGSWFCDGHECGSPLFFHDGDQEEGEPGVLVCPDCNASIWASANMLKAAEAQP